VLNCNVPPAAQTTSLFPTAQPRTGWEVELRAVHRAGMDQVRLVVGKGHDSFPHGPWIMPREFYGDPMQNLWQTLSVGSQTLQDAQAGDTTHSRNRSVHTCINRFDSWLSRHQTSHNWSE